MTAEAFSKIDTMRIHALTGPIAVDGAEPGDRLIIEILKYVHEGWGWTSIIPGLGLLDKDFDQHFLHTWELEESVTRSMPGLTLPLAPFCGLIGVQPQETGEHRTRPPGAHGGNMDVRHLIAGATLHLPVFSTGTGLCFGDAHAAQGDGEVSINGIEAPMTVTARVSLDKGTAPSGPFVECPRPLDPPAIANGAHLIFIESDPDALEASRRIVRRAMSYLSQRLGLSRQQAYVTCSVVLRLKLSQVVNRPMVTVSGYLPEGIFTTPDGLR
jgi:acetamidase/formamidase